MKKLLLFFTLLSILVTSSPTASWAQDEQTASSNSGKIYLPIVRSNTTVAATVTNATATSGANRVLMTDTPYHPLGEQQTLRRQKGLAAKLQGKARGNTHEIARGQFVELERVGEDSIWTVLAEFGTQIDPAYGGLPGPLHNQIPQPNRAVNNVTIWTPDFNRAYYEKLLFAAAPGANSMRNYYLEQSSNRYTVNGQVTDWVSVPYNAAYYGGNACGMVFCADTWRFVRDAVNSWYNAQLAAGQSPAQIDAYLSQFDRWDRYDGDGDGNFTEPDGYIDHFQAVHAGEGEETGGGVYGADAIWSHRWYAFYNEIGQTGPSPDYLLGGTRIGNSRYWVGDYTVQPENGGVGVFAHEFAHDLGLPDLYDYAGGENSVFFWSLLSHGGFGSSGIPADGLISKPTHMSAYEKIFMGWSNYTVVNYGERASIKLGPAETNTKQAQQLVVLLPDKQVEFNFGSAYAGSYYYHSNAGNNLNNTMTRQVTLPAGSVQLTAKVRYDIELDFDYAYVTINGTPVATNLSTTSNPYGQNFGYGVTGSSQDQWVDLTADLTAFADQTITLGFHYWSDAGVAGNGFALDEITITGNPTDGGESERDWTYSGFVRTGGLLTKSFFNAYYAEYRQYRGYDDALRTGPFNFGFLENPFTATWVEHFPYQDGLLVWYFDSSFDDNTVGEHCAAGRCGGIYLPVDAHPALTLRPDNGLVAPPSFQSHDATFGLAATDAFCLPVNGAQLCQPSLPGNPLFDDTQRYWVAPDPSINHLGWSGVAVPPTGTTIRVVSVSAHGEFMQVQVGPKRK